MKITVQRTGGFAGLTEPVAEIDTTQLNTETAKQIEHAVKAANFFNLPASMTGDAVGADMFQHQITVMDGARQHTVTYSGDAPDAAPLRHLVESIQRST